MNSLAAGLGLIAAAVFLAAANERLVGHFDPLWDKVPVNNFKRYVSFVTGVGLGWLFQIDLVSSMIPTTPIVPWAGTFVTALIIGGGSNLVHYFWPKDH